MADLQRMESALRNAHKAGDVDAAKKIANALKAARAQQAQPESDLGPIEQTDPYEFRAKQEADALENMLGGQTGSTVASKIAQGGTFGFADEISSALNSPFRAIRDQVGLGEAYKREHALQNEQLRRMQEKDPVLATAAEVGGAIGTGTGLAGAGLSLTKRALGRGLGARMAAGAGDGAIYGGLYGAGTAEGGLRERVEKATSSAATGAVIGGAVPAVGQAIGKTVSNVRQARANKAFEKAAPMVDEIRAQESQLFETARASGVRVKPQSMDRLIDNMTLAAGRRNENLRQKTAGVLDDILDMKGKPADVQDIHEIRQTINKAMSNADDGDVRTLTRMKDVLDGFIDNADQTQVTGGREGLDTLRAGIDLSAKRFKAEEIEKLIDFADVKTGRYSQSGMVNALRTQADQLYKKIINGRIKGFTAEETAIVRALAKVETQSAANKLLSKFAPRGPVSMGMGAIMGAQVMGPIGAAIPAAMGAAAARGADKSALAAVNTLRAMAATGATPRTVSPLLSPVTGRAVPGLTIAGAGLAAKD